MKKSFILIVACIFAFATVQAQSSEVEATSQRSKAEQFLENTSFIKEEQVFKHQGGGIKILAKIFTDLKTGEQIAALEFRPTLGSALLTSAFGGVSGALGYLDMEHIDDLVLVLETILEEVNNSSKKDEYTITYSSPSGISVTYTEIQGGGLTAPTFITFYRRSYYINEYGIRTQYISGTATSNVTDLAKLINDIRESQIVCEKKLVEGTPLTMDAILAAKAAKQEVIAAEEFRKEEERRIAEEKKRKEKEASDAYKKEVTNHLIQVQQEYKKLELTDTSIFTAYKKAISQLMMSRLLEDWKTLDTINTLMETLTKEDCTIDKTVLETRLAEKTTPDEMIEVFKTFL